MRMSDELAQAVDAAAAANGVSSAAWIRDLAVKATMGVSLHDQQPSPRREPRPNLTGGEAELRAMVRTLGVVGGATVMLAKALRERGRLEEHREAELVLRDMKQAAFEATQLVRRLKR